MSEFRFGNTFTMTESQYVALWGILPSRSPSGWMKVIAASAVGILFLFTPYTLLLGVILLGLIVLAIFAPQLLLGGSRLSFRGQDYLQDAITYEVTDQRLWVRSARIEASASWSMLTTWQEKEGWLILSASGIPRVLLSLARLREEGLYGRVRALAASNAPEYGTSRK